MIPAALKLHPLYAVLPRPHVLPASAAPTPTVCAPKPVPQGIAADAEWISTADAARLLDTYPALLRSRGSRLHSMIESRRDGRRRVWRAADVRRVALQRKGGA